MVKNDLAEYARNVHSQNGEDGILLEIIRRIEQNFGIFVNPKCVEFGAWDGKHLSNTYNLIDQYHWQSILIESDPKKFKTLNQSISSENCTKINCLVELEGSNSLDQILLRNDFPSDFELLSIDIDGLDYWILESLEFAKPKITVIEYNPSIPAHLDFIQPKNFKVQVGSSAYSLNRLASQKGYVLAAKTRTNLIFVRELYAEAVVGNSQTNLQDYFTDSIEDFSVVFAGYDGTVFLSKPFELPWHGIYLDSKRIQILPKFMRRIPVGDSFIFRIYMKALRLARIFN